MSEDIPLFGDSTQQPTLVKTADGSYTLKIGDGDNSEAMHSPAGAWGETIHVYLPVLEQIQNWFLVEPRLLSVGLGLGYVEILIAGFFCKNKISNFYLESFEVDTRLKSVFLDWLCFKKENFVYEDILIRGSEFFQIDSRDVKTFLRDAYEGERWNLRGTLDSNTGFSCKYNGIFFDAFSRLSEDLWTPQFLDNFLNAATAPRCVFATYAARSTLKRALEKARFNLTPRNGWGKKRECTLALRDQF